jgi:hypothetical protein
MLYQINQHRRSFLETAALGIAASQLAATQPLAQAVDTTGTASSAGASSPLNRLEPLKNINAGVLDTAYYETGPADGSVAILMHGFPYDTHSYVMSLGSWLHAACASSFLTCVATLRRGFSMPRRYAQESRLQSAPI